MQKIVQRIRKGLNTWFELQQRQSSNHYAQKARPKIRFALYTLFSRLIDHTLLFQLQVACLHESFQLFVLFAQD